MEKLLVLFLSALNEYKELITLFSTLMLVCLTAYYAWQTKRTVDSMEQSRKNHERPKLSIYLEQRKENINIVDLKITNYGGSPATDLVFDLNKDFFRKNGGDSVKETRILRRGMKYLPSNTTKNMLDLLMIDNQNLFKENDVTITVNYKDLNNKEYQEVFPIDFISLQENQLSRSSGDKMTKNLEDIARAIQRLSRENLK